MRKAVAYIRVSREDENPENQLFTIQRWAKEHRYDVVPFMDYAISGAVDPFERPGFKMMLNYMKTNSIRTIIVAELERLTRDVEHYEKLKDLKKLIGWAIEEDIEIISIADYKFTELINKLRSMVDELRETIGRDAKILKPFSKFMEGVVGLFAELLPEIRIAMAEAERDRIAERTKRALERLKAEGRLYTKPTIIHWIALYRAGKKNLKELTREDIEEAERYFYEQYVKPYKERVAVNYLYKKFLNQEKPVLEMIRRYREKDLAERREKGLPLPKKPTLYNSYYSFYYIVKKLSQRT